MEEMARCLLISEGRRYVLGSRLGLKRGEGEHTHTLVRNLLARLRLYRTVRLHFGILPIFSYNAPSGLDRAF